VTFLALSAFRIHTVAVSTPDPGWYPDPQESALARWWDGTQWSSATQPVASVNPVSVKPRRQIDDNFRRLALVVQLLLVVTVLVDAAVIWGDLFVLDVADQFISRAPDPDDAATSDRINQISGLGYLLMAILTGIVFIRWLFVAHSSDRMHPESMRHKSGWAIGGWFVPVLNLWRPFGVTIDLRRGILGPGEKATTLMWAWWLTWLASLVADRVAAALWSADDAVGLRGFGRDLRDAAQADIVSSVIDMVAAVLAILVVRHLTMLLRDAPVVS
jgi:hypothetical protein